MKLAIESTDEVGLLMGIPVRVRRGLTEGGHPVDVYVALVGTDDPAARLEINLELGGDAGPVEVAFVAHPGRKP